MRYVCKTRYGLTLEEYEAKLEAQGPLCMICEEEMIPGDTHRRPSLDHNHDTGHLRDFLCDLCNRGIGHFGEDPKRLVAAAFYLIQHEASTPTSQKVLVSNG